MLSDDSLRGAPLLVLANKMDISNVGAKTIVNTLGLENIRDR